MPDDLPAIDPSLDAPLPQVDPNSQLVPYRLSRTDPGGQPIVTTGYGPRARPPIQPPGGGGAGFPDLDRVANAAFSNLPVDQASKAIEIAMRYQGQRGYMKDLQSGQMNAAQAFAKWAPMMFRQATGIPEAIERTVPPPISPQQMIQNRLNQQKFEAAQAAAKAKADAATRMTPYQQAQIDLKKSAQTKAPTMAPDKKAELSDAYKELDEARKDMAKNADQEITSPVVVDAMTRMDQARKRIAAIGAVNPAQSQAQSPFKEGQIVKNKKDGKTYKIVNGQPVPVKQ